MSRRTKATSNRPTRCASRCTVRARPIAAATPALSFAFTLHVNHKIHVLLPGELLYTKSDIFKVRRLVCDDVNDTLYFLAAVGTVIVSVVMVSMSIARIAAIVDPESWCGVADYATHFAKFLKYVLDVVLQLIWDDEKEFLTRRHHQWHCRSEDEDRDDDCCDGVPAIPWLPQSHDCAQNDCQGASRIRSNMQEDTVHVVVV